MQTQTCLSAQVSTIANLARILIPHSLLQRDEVLVTKLLKSHMLTEWKSWENNWIVRAALTRQRRNKDIADDSMCKISSEKNAWRVNFLFFNGGFVLWLQRNSKH